MILLISKHRYSRGLGLTQWSQGLHIDGLVQDCSNSSALTMELLQPCSKPSIWYDWIGSMLVQVMVWRHKPILDPTMIHHQCSLVDSTVSFYKKEYLRDVQSVTSPRGQGVKLWHLKYHKYSSFTNDSTHMMNHTPTFWNCEQVFQSIHSAPWMKWALAIKTW